MGGKAGECLDVRRNPCDHGHVFFQVLANTEVDDEAGEPADRDGQ